MHRSHRGEIAFRSVVRSLGVRDVGGQFRNQEVEVGIALTMRVGGFIDRHAIHESGQVRAMVKIVAAQQVLIGLAFAAMARDLQSRHGFQQLAHPKHRCQCQLIVDDNAFAGGAGAAHEPQPFGGYLDFLKWIRCRRRLRPRGEHGGGRQQGYPNRIARLSPSSGHRYLLWPILL